MRSSSIPFHCVVAGSIVALAFVLGSGCSGAKHSSGFDDGTGDDAGVGEGGVGLGGGTGQGACTGLACQVEACSGGTDETTLSGTAFAPNGTLALYNVIAFIPNAPLTPFTEGVSCDTCGSVSGSPITTATSDATGKFVLKGVPAGDNIPLVLQVGKWRRQVTIPHVTKCQDNPITDTNLTRLPKNHTEGDIPHIAVTTGDCDAIACVLPKMGIDASEFGVQADYATKRVIMYQPIPTSGSVEDTGGPATAAGITSAQNLWGDPTEIAKYDVAVFSCECSERQDTKNPNDVQVVTDYLNAGGRTFGTDFMYTWTHKGTESGAGTPPAPIESIMESFVGGAPPDNGGNYSIDTTFPKGVALGQWLQSVGGSTSANSIDLEDVYKNFGRVDPTLGQRWVYGDSDKAISYTTPFSLPEAQRCGKSYFMDVHVGSGSVDETFPAGCGTELSPQEKMMVFFLMDLASCIQDDSQPVNPPR
jgi:hypothetical protein